jgi:hypothetical protein
MDIVFVVGLALEGAGATLLAAEVLTRDPLAIARRGLLIAGPDEPQRKDQLEPARALVGFGLLVVGVIVQLFGYAAHGGWWLLALAAVVIAVAYLAGRVAGNRFVATWLHGQALAYWAKRQRGDT